MGNPVKKETDALNYARSVLEAEAQAILGLANSLGDSFEHAVSLIEALAPGARVIVSGIGKTGFVAMKISATLASIGVPSFFLHPSEALHGDLGRYTKNDLAFLLSNSGETPEILRIVPHLKRIGCSIISVSSDSSSKLAQHSDVALSIGKLVEAGPLGLAPTTSTTVMLALGDALAMTIFNSRDYSKEQFAFYHPGGNLGASLMPVTEVMRKGDEHCVVNQTQKAREVLHKIAVTPGKPGAASIVDQNGKLVGVFTDGDLRRCLDQNSNFLDFPIGDVMGKNPKTILKDKLAPEALRLLSANKIDQIIVVDESHTPLGMVDIQDLVDIGLG